MKKQVKDWLFLAESDLRTADIVIKDEYPLTNIARFIASKQLKNI